jgi:hypothetical protein
MYNSRRHIRAQKYRANNSRLLVAYVALVAFVAVALFAMHYSHRITVSVAVESDCNDYYGAYALVQVERVAPYNVHCIYR